MKLIMVACIDSQVQGVCSAQCTESYLHIYVVSDIEEFCWIWDAFMGQLRYMDQTGLSARLKVNEQSIRLNSDDPHIPAAN